MHNICLKILDVVFLMRDVIYKRLYKLVTGNEYSTAKRSVFSMVENDDVLLAAAVIGTAAHIACEETHQKVKCACMVKFHPCPKFVLHSNYKF